MINNLFILVLYKTYMNINNVNITWIPLTCSKVMIQESKSTIQREQYDVTVHLFIGTGRSPSKSTFMSSVFTHDRNTCYKGLSSLFLLRSSSLFLRFVASRSFSVW
jgi:hypothetical protein